MNCTTFQQHLEALIDDTLSPAMRREADRHVVACPRCRELEALARGDLEIFPVEPPGDLAAAILERTTGSACTRARELLCDYVDAHLDGIETDLLRQHLDGCAGCRAAEHALARLADDLPTMSRLTPDAAFVGDVLSATRPRRERFDRRLAALADGWQRLLDRPRFGLEAGYVGAVALWVLFGLSASPLAGLPQQALLVLQHGPTSGVQKTTRAMTTLQTQIGEVGRRTWQASTQQGADTLDEWTSGVNRRLDRTAAARDSLRLRGSELGGAALRLDFDRTARAARGIGAGLGNLWRQLKTPNEDDSTAAPQTGSDEC